MTRQQRRKIVRDQRKVDDYIFTGHGKKVGQGRLYKWLVRHPKLAPFYQMATDMLGAGAKWHAIRKMMVIIAGNPKVKHIDGRRYPFIALQARHERGSWRSYPRVVIDANLKVAS